MQAPEISDFEIVKPISRGAFGKVFLGYKKQKPEQKYAIKVMRKQDMVNKNMVSQVIAERNAMSLSKSPFIVHLYYCLQTPESVYLVMEYMIGGDVKSLLTVFGCFEESMAVTYLMQVVQALAYLHKHAIIHRDLKPDNMLISREGLLKLTDFGLSKLSHDTQIRICDLLNTPGVKKTLARYHRTPGQVLSLTSNLSFAQPERRNIVHARQRMVSTASLNRSFMDSPCKTFSASQLGSWVETPETETPPPVCSLTPTLKLSTSWRRNSSVQGGEPVRLSARLLEGEAAGGAIADDDSVFLADSAAPPVANGNAETSNTTADTTAERVCAESTASDLAETSTQSAPDKNIYQTSPLGDSTQQAADTVMLRRPGTLQTVAFHLSDNMEVSQAGQNSMSESSDDLMPDAQLTQPARNKLLARVRSERVEGSGCLSDREVSFLERQCERRRTIGEAREAADKADDDTPHMERTHAIIPRSAAVEQLRSLRDESHEETEEQHDELGMSCEEQDAVPAEDSDILSPHVSGDSSIVEGRTRRCSEESERSSLIVTEAVLAIDQLQTAQQLQSQQLSVDGNSSNNSECPAEVTNLSQNGSHMETEKELNTVAPEENSVPILQPTVPSVALRRSHIKRLRQQNSANSRVSTDSIELCRHRVSCGTPIDVHLISRVTMTPSSDVSTEPVVEEEEVEIRRLLYRRHFESEENTRRKRSHDAISQSPVRGTARHRGKLSTTGLTGAFGCVALSDRSRCKRLSVQATQFLSADELAADLNTSSMSSASDANSVRAEAGSPEHHSILDTSMDLCTGPLDDSLPLEGHELSIIESIPPEESSQAEASVQEGSVMPHKQTTTQEEHVCKRTDESNIQSSTGDKNESLGNSMVEELRTHLSSAFVTTPPRKQSSPLVCKCAAMKDTELPSDEQLPKTAVNSATCDNSDRQPTDRDETDNIAFTSNTLSRDCVCHGGMRCLISSVSGAGCMPAPCGPAVSGIVFAPGKLTISPIPSVHPQTERTRVDSTALTSGGDLPPIGLPFSVSSPLKPVSTGARVQWQDKHEILGSTSSSIGEITTDMDCSSPMKERYDLPAISAALPGTPLPASQRPTAPVYATPTAALPPRTPLRRHVTPGPSPLIRGTPLAIVNGNTQHRRTPKRTPLAVANSNSGHMMSPLVGGAPQLAPVLKMSPHLVHLKSICKMPGEAKKNPLKKVAHFQSMPGGSFASTCSDRAPSNHPHRTPTSSRRRAFITPVGRGAWAAEGGAASCADCGAEDGRVLGTPDYLAPELLLRNPHGPPVDWWALGVCLFEFLTGVPPFNDETPELVFENILNRNIPWPEEDGERLSDEATACIEALLSMEPKQRATALELRVMSLFAGRDWQNVQAQEPPFLPAPDTDDDTTYFQARNNIQNLQVSSMKL